jgi:tight adherence protein B
VARAVDRTAATLRERQELRGEVRALATQARASAAVLALAPLAFAGLVATIEPAATTFLVASPVGWACLGGGLVLELVGAVWMSRITGGAE